MTADESDTSTPLGVRLVSVLFGIYGLFWLLAWVLATSYGNAAIAVLSVAVAAGVLVLAVLLYSGNTLAWVLAVVVLAASTLWRFSLVANGRPDNLTNALVGVLLVGYLLARYEFFVAPA